MSRLPAEKPRQRASVVRRAEPSASWPKEGTDAAGPAYRGGLLLDAGKPTTRSPSTRRLRRQDRSKACCAAKASGLASSQGPPPRRTHRAPEGYEDALAAFTTMQPDETGRRRVRALHQAGSSS